MVLSRPETRATEVVETIHGTEVRDPERACSPHRRARDGVRCPAELAPEEADVWSFPLQALGGG